MICILEIFLIICGQDTASVSDSNVSARPVCYSSVLFAVGANKQTLNKKFVFVTNVLLLYDIITGTLLSNELLTRLYRRDKNEIKLIENQYHLPVRYHNDSSVRCSAVCQWIYLSPQWSCKTWSANLSH